ncbi:MAG: (Fe-S)-binding protein [Deltaproteobacteria bacterium]|nr:(Fe-S)-binding protein [Deltaproteobacteria bacterium]
MKTILEEIKSCTDCGLCVEVCPTYAITGEDLFSPMQRLKTAGWLFDGEALEPRLIESLYNCPKCMQCDVICPEEIQITRVIHSAREELARRGLGPLERHNSVIKGIMRKGNSVNGDPAKRLEWLPGEFPKHESDTLLYLGCLPSFIVKDAAASTYLALKKLDLDFMILKDEGCCGTYLYESGKTDLAGEFFEKNLERFRALGIKRIVVPCNGCLKCFKYFYPDLLGETDISVHHAVEVIYDLLKDNPGVLKKIERTAVYQDSCRLGRGEGITEEPRRILDWCGLELKELKNNREDALCCGAGGGIRSVYRDLSLKIAAGMLREAETESVISACPFCVFNLNYASAKMKLGKNIKYFSEFVLESLE